MALMLKCYKNVDKQPLVSHFHWSASKVLQHTVKPCYIFELSHNALPLRKKVITSFSYSFELMEIVFASFSYCSNTIEIVSASYTVIALR